MRNAVRALFVALTIIVGSSAAEAACTPTGFVRDGINLTAALINPPDTVSGVINASGCHIGVYYGPGAAGEIREADIWGANYFGVVVNGASGTTLVDIADSEIHDIGETSFNGAQHGVGIYYAAFTASGSAGGKVSGNRVYRYQKGGIVANGEGVNVIISDNQVTGLGAVPFIAQNGIQVGFGANASVMRNEVTDNSYTGPGWVSGGILVVGGPCYGLPPYTTGTQIVRNTVGQNDVGVFLSNLSATCEAPATATNIKVVNNVIFSSAVTNGFPYQAGISDVGNNDKLIGNTVSGYGYDPNTLPGSTFFVDADESFTNRPKVHANK